MALDFVAASSQYLEMDSALISSFPYSMSIIFNADNITETMYPINISDKDVTNEQTAILLNYQTDGSVKAISYSSGDGLDDAETTSQFTAGVINQATAVFASATDRRIFLNGGSKGTDATLNTPAWNYDRTSLGRAGDSTPGYYMDGMIAEAAVWAGIALTDEEAAALGKLYSPLLIKPQYLIHLWQLIRGELVDIIGGYSLTAYNSPSVIAHPPVLQPTKPFIISYPSAVSDVEIYQVKKSINVTPKTHKVAIDILNPQTKKTINATPKTHSAAIGAAVLHTKKSVQGGAKTHATLIDEAISQTKSSIDATAKSHSLAIDQIINQVIESINAASKTHGVAIDVLTQQVKKQCIVTPKTHAVVIDEIVNQVKQSVEIAAKTHAVLIDVAISQTKQSIDVTGKTHSALIDVAHTQSKQSVQVVPKSHTIVIDVINLQTKQSVEASAKTHQVAIGITIEQIKQSIEATPKTHSALIDVAIPQIKERIEADPKTHTVQISEDIEINQIKQTVDITAKTHSLLIDEAISQIKQAIQADAKTHAVAIDELINQIKQSVQATPKTHVVVLDEIINQVAQSVDVTGKTHSVAIDEIINQISAVVAATAKTHRVALSEIINQSKQSIQADTKTHSVVVTPDIEIQQVIKHILATGKSHSIIIVGGFIIIIGKGLQTMDRKVIFNFDYPQNFLPVIELNQNSTAHGDITLNVEDLEEVTSLTAVIYSVNPPSSTSDNWTGVGNDLYTSNILQLTSKKLTSGKIAIGYSFDPSPIVGIGDGQFYGIIIKVNAADDASIPQAGVEMIMKINNLIETP